MSSTSSIIINSILFPSIFMDIAIKTLGRIFTLQMSSLLRFCLQDLLAMAIIPLLIWNVGMGSGQLRNRV